MNTILKNTLKITAAGSVVFAIGFATLTQNPQEPTAVKEAEADISFFNGKDGTEFTRAMASLGLKPRPYDFNGNVMYFASGYADGKTPADVMHIVQDELVNYGVNKRNYSDVTPMQAHLRSVDWRQDKNGESFEPIQDISKAYISGEVVPIEKSSGYIAMAGVNPQKSYEKVLEDYKKHKELGLNEQLGGYRFIDATHEPNLERTMITAVWSDDEFSSNKFENKSFIKPPPDPNIPACIGCDRDFRMKSLASNEPYTANKFTTNADLDTTYNFYRQAMINRGWNESGFQDKMNKLAQHLPEARIQGRFLNLEKGDQAMNIIMLPAEDGKVNVYATEEGRGAQQGMVKLK